MSEGQYTQFLALQQWYASATGKNVWQAEKQLLDSCLPNLFGYHLMSIGMCPDLPLAEASPIHHLFSVGNLESLNAGLAARCHTHALPIASESVDVAILHHCLDYSDSPHRLLREVARTIMPYGSVLILGFHRWSALGLQQTIQHWIDPENALTSHQFIALHRMHDWLKLLDFEIVESKYTLYAPPQWGEGVREYWRWLDTLGGKMQLPLGGVYFIWARKTMGSVRPLIIDTDKEKRSLNPLEVLAPKPIVPVTRPSKNY